MFPFLHWRQGPPCLWILSLSCHPEDTMVPFLHWTMRCYFPSVPQHKTHFHLYPPLSALWKAGFCRVCQLDSWSSAFWVPFANGGYQLEARVWVGEIAVISACSLSSWQWVRSDCTLLQKFGCAALSCIYRSHQGPRPLSYS